MASTSSMPAPGPEERFDKAKKHLWQVSGAPLLVSAVDGSNEHATLQKCARRSMFTYNAYRLIHLSLIACIVPMLTPHIFATGWLNPFSSQGF
jgi:hypothetical protein